MQSIKHTLFPLRNTHSQIIAFDFESTRDKL